MTQEETPLEIDNWMSPAFMANPYPVFHALREQDPVHWNPLLRSWVLTRYDQVSAVVQAPHRFSSTSAPSPRLIAALSPEDQVALDDVALYRRAFMQSMDPPAHTRQRGLLHTSFTVQAMEPWRARIQLLVDALLDRLEPLGTMDLIKDFAYPLPSLVIFELLGIPDSLREAVKRSSETIAASVSMVNPAPGQMQQMAGTLHEVRDLLLPLIAERRSHPRDDILSLLVSVQEQGEQLSEQELVIVVTMLLFAGHETTANLIGNGLLALLKHPDQLALLRAHPALLGSALKEMLRYDPPVQVLQRTARENGVVGGKNIKQGEVLLLVVGAANRDPAYFVEPDRLNIERKPDHNLSFGYGIHYCLGAALAQLEGQIAIGSLLQRFPRLELATNTITWRRSIALRGLAELQVVY